MSAAVPLATPALDESSGLEYCRGKLWTHNDSGGEPEIYAINPATGAITQTIILQGITNVDWEDLASDGYYLYIADTGNNVNGSRTNLAIYKINLDDIPQTGDGTIPSDKIETIRFYYPEQGLNPTPTSNNNTSYDCEAILIRNDNIHLFTKDWISEKSGSYKTTEYLVPNIPHPTGNKYPATKFNEHNTTFLVTGADDAGMNQVALIGYQTSGLGNHYVRIYSGFQGDDISTGEVYIKSLSSAALVGQIEAICFGENPRTGYISNEQFDTKIPFLGIIDAMLQQFDISYTSNAPVLVTGVSLNKSTATIAVGGNETLTSTLNPTNAADQIIIWTSSDPAIASVSRSGVVTAIAAGTATITATADNSNYKATCVVTVEESFSTDLFAGPKVIVNGNMVNTGLMNSTIPMILQAPVFNNSGTLNVKGLEVGSNATLTNSGTLNVN
ncbi:hypothetical protein FACS189437_10600 [Bacteroidia bacterium]|nr:hypothetical protein FACS189437_10600 [Bacteroidia bacterium]